MNGINPENEASTVVAAKRKKRWRAGLIATGTAVLVAGAGVGAALAAPTPAESGSTSSGSPSATSSAVKQGADKKVHHSDGFGRGKMEHAEAVVQRQGKNVTVERQRGTIQTVSASSVTVKSADGFTASYAITADSKLVRPDGQGDHKRTKIAATDLKAGDTVGVDATKSGGTDTLTHLFLGTK